MYIEQTHRLSPTYLNLLLMQYPKAETVTEMIPCM